MPNKVVIRLSEQTHRPVYVVEAIWRRAKRFASIEGEKGNYLRVLEISKRMLGITDTMKRVKIGQTVVWHSAAGCLLGTVEGTLPESCMIRLCVSQQIPTTVLCEVENHHGILTVPLLDVSST